MSVFPSFFPTLPSLLNRALILMACLGVTMLLAEGCVKRPNWEPTPGVSTKGVEFNRVLNLIEINNFEVIR